MRVICVFIRNIFCLGGAADFEPFSIFRLFSDLKALFRNSNPETEKKYMK